MPTGTQYFCAGSFHRWPCSAGKHIGDKMIAGTHDSLRTLYEDDPAAAEALCSVKLGLSLVSAAYVLPTLTLPYL
jgi:hypothetical protein